MERVLSTPTVNARSCALARGALRRPRRAFDAIHDLVPMGASQDGASGPSCCLDVRRQRASSFTVSATLVYPIARFSTFPSASSSSSVG
jgi:hypothetical protein